MAEVNSSAVKENTEDQGRKTSSGQEELVLECPASSAPIDFRVTGPTRDAPCSVNQRCGKKDTATHARP